MSKHDNLPGRRGREGLRPSSAATLQLFKRLRRVELAVTHLLVGKPKDFDLVQYADSVIQLRDDARRGPDKRGEVQVPQEGSAPGETPGKAGASGGLEGWSDEQIRAELEALEEAEKDEFE